MPENFRTADERAAEVAARCRARPRVAFVIDTLGRGGTQRAIASVAEHLADRFAFQIVGLGTDVASDDWFRAAGSRIDVLGAARWNPCVGARLAETLRDFGSELVVAALFKSSVVVPSVATSLGVPYALADRSRTYDSRVRDGFFPAPGLSGLYWFAYRHAARQAALMLVQSCDDVRAYERAVPSLRGRIVAIPNAVDVGRFALDEDTRLAARHDMRARWRIPDDVVVHGSVMGLRRDKRPWIMAEAAEFLGERERVVVVGDGPDAPRVRKGSRAHFVGHMAWSEIPRALAAFDVFVLPSIEGFPNAVLEAMAAGLPIVAMAAGACAEIVIDGDTGLLVAPSAGPSDWAATLAALARDAVARRRMGEAGRRRATKAFSVDAFVANWTSALARAIPAGSRTAATR